MSIQTYEIELSGCTPVPLAHYLKALGVLRLVSEQVDPNAKGWWKNDRFWLRSKLDREGLIHFFLEDYAPTPLVGPWGARSGFFPAASERSARQALETIDSSSKERLQPFKTAISETRKILTVLGLTEKAETDGEKLRLLRCCRSNLSDDLLQWLDAVYVLLSDNRAFPPLLGTGGNEGSGSYMSGFAQQVVSVIEERNWDHALTASLFNQNVSDTGDKQTPGHFSPDAAGGVNAGSGFEGALMTNPWDYLLSLEGTLFFAASSVKRLEDHSDGSLAYPFCVRPSGVGYPSEDLSDESSTRAEMWFPLWNRPTTQTEIDVLFSEGRGSVSQRKVRNGIDFARAVSSVGIDRGIQQFIRYGFQQRNGLSNFAIPLGRFHTSSSATDTSALLNPLDQWLDRFRRAATGKNATGRAGRALRQVESAILKLCQRGETQDVQELLIALGEAEATVAISKKLREGEKGNGIRPVPLLSTQWLHHAYDKESDNSVEFRLAAALASVRHSSVGPFRRHLEPLDHASWKSLSSKHPFLKWAGETNDPSLVWGGGSLVRNMLNVLNRRIIDVQKSGKDTSSKELQAPLYGRLNTSLGDISAFITGDVDDQRIESLLKGLILIDWSSLSKDQWVALQGPLGPKPDAAYSLLKLCHLNLPAKSKSILPKDLILEAKMKSIRLDPRISRLAIAGKISEATQVASRRLRASGFRPALEQVYLSGETAKRTAAALLFPIDKSSAKQLVKRVIRCEDDDNKEEKTSETTTSIST